MQNTYLNSGQSVILRIQSFVNSEVILSMSILVRSNEQIKCRGSTGCNTVLILVFRQIMVTVYCFDGVHLKFHNFSH